MAFATTAAASSPHRSQWPTWRVPGAPAPSAQPPLASPPARPFLPVRSVSSRLFPSLYSFPWFFSFFLVDIILYRILIIWSPAYLFGNRLYDHPDCHVYQDLFRCRYNDNFHNEILLYTKTIWLTGSLYFSVFLRLFVMCLLYIW